MTSSFDVHAFSRYDFFDDYFKADYLNSVLEILAIPFFFIYEKLSGLSSEASEGATSLNGKAHEVPDYGATDDADNAIGLVAQRALNNNNIVFNNDGDNWSD